MKKFLSTIILVTLVIGNVMFFNFITNTLSRDFLFKDQTEVQFKYKDDFQVLEINNSIEQFSKAKNINIAQYTFLDERDLNIYASNSQYSPNIKLKKGDYPDKNRFLANRESGDEKQSGVIYHPSKYWSLKVYDFGQIKNVGLSDTFYVSGLDNQDTYQAFLKEFEQYGEITTKSVDVSWWKYINIPLLMTLLLCFVILFIFTYYYLRYSKQRLFVNRIWGNSKLVTLKSLFNKTIKFTLFSELVILVVFVGIVLVRGLSAYSVEIVSKLLLFNVFLLIFILFPMYFFGLLRIQKIDQPKSDQHMQSAKQHLAINLVIKFALLCVFIGTIIASYQSLQTLNTRLANMDVWNDAKNIFKVNVGILPENIEDDLKADRKLNDKLNAFYKEGTAKKEMFLMYSNNFTRVENDTFLYKTNLNKDSEINSPQGNSVEIDFNYLKLNPIKSAQGQNVENEAIINDKVLNIIVPISKKEFEKDIKKAYLDHFYFQKVKLANMYNEALNRPVLELGKDDLSINIIYAQNNQDYFSYDSSAGDLRTGNITDPIAIIYTGNIDSSSIGALVTSSVYFVDKTKGDAFSAILPLINNSNAREITNVTSVYQEVSSELTALKWQIYQQSIGTIILAISSYSFMILLVLSYYRENLYKQLIYHVFGYSFWKSSKWFIISNLAVCAFSGAVTFIITKEPIALYFSVVILLIELCVIYFLKEKVINKDFKAILKGEKYD
ncbi:TPA: bacteriocin-associated integral membrane family protein [Listeria innocua]|nr:bacteriocin-associated integral membrane family protein [Listeria innocua]HBN5102498.1 bacteriocin-associated integral membrane family protein [Listeria innocua]HBN5104887.1 bacteriocin-associated integral membrane family protein [Listeria innocua]HCJ1280545.1 bacteriocin-associated integral membrane family protein [Listeria innocua]